MHPQGVCRIRKPAALATAALYFKFFKPKYWDKRSADVRRRNCAVLPKKEEEPNMNDHANKCIECSVRSCAHHCENQDYCSLEQIHVGTHECHPAVDQCTDCKSFRKR